jgi:hypothetical protein
MTFLLSSLFYSFIGCLTGFFSHIFNGFIQSKIHFNKDYILKTIFNFFKVFAVMTLATLVTALLILVIPAWFYTLIGSDIPFFHELVFYLFAFAAFDFGLKN